MLDRRWTCPFLELIVSSWCLSSLAVICPCWMYNHRGSASTINRCGEQNQHLRGQYSSRASASVTKESLRKGAPPPGRWCRKVPESPPFLVGYHQTEIKNTGQRCPMFLREAEISGFTHPGPRNFRIHLPWTQKHSCWNLQSSQPTDSYLYRNSSSTKILYIMKHFVLPSSPVRRNKMTCPCFLQWAVNTPLIQPFDNGILAAPETGKSVLVSSHCPPG